MINLWSCKTVYPTGQLTIYRNGVPLFAVTRDMRDGEPEFTNDQRHSEAIQLCAAANQAPTLDDAQRAVLVEIARYIQSSNDANRPSAGVRSSAVKILNGLIDAPAPLSGEIAAAPPVRSRLNVAIREFYQRENVPLHVCSVALCDVIATAALARDPDLHATIYLMPGSHLSMARAINLANKLLPIVGIPSGVYVDGHGAFRNEKTGDSMGTDFALAWADRRDDFPTEVIVKYDPTAQASQTMGVITNETFTSYESEPIPEDDRQMHLEREFEPGTVVPPNEKYKYDPGANRNVEPIPTGVYYSREHSNFYGETSHFGQGNEFLEKWFPRRDEFPTRFAPGAAIRFTEAGKDRGVWLQPHEATTTAGIGEATGTEPRPTCSTCRHACRTDEGKAVSCHRYPPAEQGRNAWPEVNDNVWCGEHQPS